jgi:hypothetical protein
MKKRMHKLAPLKCPPIMLGRKKKKQMNFHVIMDFKNFGGIK